MKIVKMETHMLSQKVIANVTPEFARVYNIPEGHTSVGFFSADNDDIGYLAVDDASKKANIKLIHAETYYGGKHAPGVNTAAVYLYCFPDRR